jgi:hypothetical protein
MFDIQTQCAIESFGPDCEPRSRPALTNDSATTAPDSRVPQALAGSVIAAPSMTRHNADSMAKLGVAHTPDNLSPWRAKEAAINDLSPWRQRGNR